MQLADFLGDWRLTREIRHADGTLGRFEGVADWVRSENGALYTERGTLVIEGQGEFQAERRYGWDSDLRVFFDDGRFFHQVPGQGGSAGHWCDPDQYDVTYDFSAWPEWHCRWRVLGPRKDYVMTTGYRRAG